METFKQNVATDKESGETWRERQHDNTKSGIRKQNHWKRKGIRNTESTVNDRKLKNFKLHSLNQKIQGIKFSRNKGKGEKWD